MKLRLTDNSISSIDINRMIRFLRLMMMPAMLMLNNSAASTR